MACSFWLVDALHASGQQRDAIDLFERLLGLRNDVGLLSEEWNRPHTASWQDAPGVQPLRPGHQRAPAAHGERGPQRQPDVTITARPETVIDRITLIVPDLDRAEDDYVRTFGCRVEQRGDIDPALTRVIHHRVSTQGVPAPVPVVELIRRIPVSGAW